MTAPARPLDAFSRAAGVLSAHGDVDVQSIGQAMRTWLAGSGPPTLEAALQLKHGPGCRSARTVDAYRRRDAMVREMARRFYPNLKAVPAAKKNPKQYTAIAAGWIGAATARLLKSVTGMLCAASLGQSCGP